MQSYSLLIRLQQDFPEDEIEIIDYNSKKRQWFIKKCPIVFLYRRSIREGIQKYKQTKAFLKVLSILMKSKPYLSVKDKIIQKSMSECYDLIIVGSDAVFNWNDIGIPNPYFLRGVESVIKMSYAASSHLQNYKELSSDNKKYLSDALKEFIYIGVRDDSTSYFVDYVVGERRAIHNCDPTVFLKMDFNEMDLHKKMKKHKINLNKKIIFVMLMHQEYASYAKRYFGSGYQIVALMDGNRYADIYLYDLNPFEWAHVFSYGTCLITDYFHGTIFGLKNGIPVMSIDASKYNNGNYESKAHDLLYKRLNLPFLYLNGDDLTENDGYNIFTKRMTEILQQFNKEKVKQALENEGNHYKSFQEELRRLH
jgi:hypothetical protein